MVGAKHLPISGHRDLDVRNTFLYQREETSHLALLFPGRGYTCDMPLLYYTGRLLLAQGADVLQVAYGYHRRPDFVALPERAKEQWLFADARAVVDAGLAQRTYASITLVGKSLGTRALGHLLTTEPRLAAARAIWFTPLLRDESLYGEMLHCRQSSLVVIGTEDPHYDSVLLARLESTTAGKVLAFPGANHSLEIEGHLWQTLTVLEQALRAVRLFLDA